MVSARVAGRSCLIRILRGIAKTYVLVSVVMFSGQLMIGALLWWASGGETVPTMRQSDLQTGEVRTTSVVVVGALHDSHSRNRSYSREALRDIIMKSQPDLILYEIPLTKKSKRQIALARILPDVIYDRYPELWAVVSAANEMDVPVLPFDWSERDTFYEQQNYLQRWQSATQSIQAWSAYANHQDSSAHLADLITHVHAGERALSEEGSPRVNNSAARDALSRTRHVLRHGIVPDQMDSQVAFQESADELRWFDEVWEHRNRIMVRNIRETVAKYDVNRVLVVTGATHRYSLIPSLKDTPNLVVQEYWELPRN